jgi:hypothetical protein
MSFLGTFKVCNTIKIHKNHNTQPHKILISEPIGLVTKFKEKYQIEEIAFNPEDCDLSTYIFPVPNIVWHNKIHQFKPGMVAHTCNSSYL